jgi:hypothetical protein
MRFVYITSSDIGFATVNSAGIIRFVLNYVFMSYFIKFLCHLNPIKIRTWYELFYPENEKGNSDLIYGMFVLGNKKKG